jgi:hypothetical protein
VVYDLPDEVLASPSPIRSSRSAKSNNSCRISAISVRRANWPNLVCNRVVIFTLSIALVAHWRNLDRKGLPGGGRALRSFYRLEGWKRQYNIAKLGYCRNLDR